jgi:hypothetical protein
MSSLPLIAEYDAAAALSAAEPRSVVAHQDESVSDAEQDDAMESVVRKRQKELFCLNVEVYLSRLVEVSDTVNQQCIPPYAMEYRSVSHLNAHYLCTIAERARQAARLLLAQADALTALAAKIPRAELTALPSDCIAHIVRYLGLNSRTNFSATCKTCANITHALNTDTHANIDNAGTLIERGELLHYTKRRYALEWTKVRKVTINCNEIRTSFAEYKWVALQKFVEIHIARMYPFARTLHLVCNIWPTYSLKEKAHRINVPKNMSLCVDTYARYDEPPDYETIVNPSSVSTLHVTKWQTSHAQQNVLQLALLSDRVPNLRTLHLHTHGWYNALHSITHDNGVPTTHFIDYTQFKVFMKEAPIAAHYNRALIQQLLLHTSTLVVKLSYFENGGSPLEFLTVMLEELTRLQRTDIERRTVGYIGPRVYVFGISAKLLRTVGVIGLADTFTVYLVLNPAHNIDNDSLELYFKKKNKPQFLRFAVAPDGFKSAMEEGGIQDVPHPHCETIAGTLRYHSLHEMIISEEASSDQIDTSKNPA